MAKRRGGNRRVLARIGSDGLEGSGDDVQRGYGESQGGEELPKGYESVARSVLGAVDEKSQPAVAQVLNSGNAVQAYKDMKESGMSPAEIERMIRNGLNDIAKGRGGFSARAYTAAVAEQLGKYAEHIDVVKDMYREGLIDKHEYNSIVGKMKDKVDESTKNVSRGLEGLAKAAVWIMISLGAVLILLSGFSMTGAVIGSVVSPTLLFFVGLVLFLVGLFLSKSV